jgi:hypothetical protein
MCALYRIAVQGWRKEEAIKEMTQGGFGFHGIWHNLIRWINSLDVEGIKKRAGIKQGTQTGEDRGAALDIRQRVYDSAVFHPAILFSLVTNNGRCPYFNLVKR